MEHKYLLLFLAAILLVAVAVFLITGHKNAPSPSENATPISNSTTNASTPAIVNAPPENIYPPNMPPPQPEITNETAGELLAEGLARADSRFYGSGPNGTIIINTFTWGPMPLNQAPDSMPLKANDLRVSNIRFNGRYIDSLRGFAINDYEFQEGTAPPKIYGTLLFISENTTLENTTFTLDIDNFPGSAKSVDGCSIIATRSLLSQNLTYLKIYDFSCKIMYGAY